MRLSNVDHVRRFYFLRQQTGQYAVGVIAVLREPPYSAGCRSHMCSAMRRIIDESADQDSTDLQKCIKCAHELIASKPDQLQGASIFAAGSCNVSALLLRSLTPPILSAAAAAHKLVRPNMQCALLSGFAFRFRCSLSCWCACSSLKQGAMMA